MVSTEYIKIDDAAGRVKIAFAPTGDTKDLISTAEYSSQFTLYSIPCSSGLQYGDTDRALPKSEALAVAAAAIQG